jgi:glycosyltransferase involved in cell wall biosynthesis
VDYHAELEAFASKHLNGKVTFLRSFRFAGCLSCIITNYHSCHSCRSDDDKLVLLHRCCALVYTPENEHFGICPVEAMYMSRPVIAVGQ